MDGQSRVANESRADEVGPSQIAADLNVASSNPPNGKEVSHDAPLSPLNSAGAMSSELEMQPLKQNVPFEPLNTSDEYEDTAALDMTSNDGVVAAADVAAVAAVAAAVESESIPSPAVNGASVASPAVDGASAASSAVGNESTPSPAVDGASVSSPAIEASAADVPLPPPPADVAAEPDVDLPPPPVDNNSILEQPNEGDNENENKS